MLILQNTSVPKGSLQTLVKSMTHKKTSVSVVQLLRVILLSPSHSLSQGLQSESQKLFNIAQELLHTEEAYVKRLNLLDQVSFTLFPVSCTLLSFASNPRKCFTQNPCTMSVLTNTSVFTSKTSQLNDLYS